MSKPASAKSPPPFMDEEGVGLLRHKVFLEFAIEFLYKRLAELGVQVVELESELRLKKMSIKEDNQLLQRLITQLRQATGRIVDKRFKPAFPI